MRLGLSQDVCYSNIIPMTCAATNLRSVVIGRRLNSFVILRREKWNIHDERKGNNPKYNA